MKLFNKRMLAVLLGFVFLLKQAQGKEYRRVGIFLDEFGAEHSGKDGKPAIAMDLAVYLHQKIGPAFVYKSILKNFFERKYTFQAHYGLGETNFLKLIHFDLSEWDIYTIEKTPFFALLPKGYSHRDTIVVDNKNINIAVFKVTDWKKFDSTKSLQDLYTYINQSKPTKFSIDHLKKIFQTDKDLRQKKIIKDALKLTRDKELATSNLLHTFFKPLTIFLAGHGNVSQKIGKGSTVLGGLAGIPTRSAEQVFQFFNQLHTNAVFLVSCSAGGKNLDFAAYRSDLSKKKLVDSLNYMLIINAITDAPTISGYGTQSGTFSIQEKNVISQMKFEGLEHKLNFDRLFDALEPEEKIVIVKGERVSKRGHVEKQFLLKTIFDSFSVDAWYFTSLGINSIPQIWFPGTGWFQTYQFHPDILVLGDVLARKHHEEGTELSIKDRLAVLVYPAYVTVPVQVAPKVYEKSRASTPQWLADWKNFPVLSESSAVYTGKGALYNIFYPTFISKNDESDMHGFASIDVTSHEENGQKMSGILHFLRDSFLNLQQRVTKKTYVIKKLRGYNDIPVLSVDAGKQIELTDVVLQTHFDSGSNTVKHAFVFKYDGNYWEYERAVWKFKQISKNTYDQRVKGMSAKLAEFVKRFDSVLGEQKKRDSIVKALEKKIDVGPQAMSVATQKPKVGVVGALETLKETLIKLARTLAFQPVKQDFSKIFKPTKKYKPLPEDQATDEKKYYSKQERDTFKACYKVLDSWLESFPKKESDLITQLQGLADTMQYVPNNLADQFAQAMVQKLSSNEVSTIAKIIDKKFKDQSVTVKIEWSFLRYSLYRYQKETGGLPWEIWNMRFFKPVTLVQFKPLEKEAIEKMIIETTSMGQGKNFDVETFKKGMDVLPLKLKFIMEDSVKKLFGNQFNSRISILSKAIFKGKKDQTMYSFLMGLGSVSTHFIDELKRSPSDYFKYNMCKAFFQNYNFFAKNLGYRFSSFKDQVKSAIRDIKVSDKKYLSLLSLVGLHDKVLAKTIGKRFIIKKIVPPNTIVFHSEKKYNFEHRDNNKFMQDLAMFYMLTDFDKDQNKKHYDWILDYYVTSKADIIGRLMTLVAIVKRKDTSPFNDLYEQIKKNKSIKSFINAYRQSPQIKELFKDIL